MKKSRVLAIIIIAILLIAVGLCSIFASGVSNPKSVYGNDRRDAFIVHEDWSTETMYIDEMKDIRNNIYCVEHGQNFKSQIDFKSTIKVEINGKTASFYKRSGSQFNKLQGTVTNEANNILGAILTDGNVDGKKGYVFGENATYTYGHSMNRDSINDGGWKDWIYTDAQLGVYAYINTWIDAVGATSYGFEKQSSNLTDDFTSDQNNWASAIVEQAINFSRSYSYKVTFYLLKDNNSNNQSVIVTYPEAPKREDIDIQVTKYWEDNNDEYGNRPHEITVKLFANGEDTWKTLTLRSSEGWTGKFTGLQPNDSNGNAIVYTIEEVQVTGYNKGIINGYTITNTPETINIPVAKRWDDDSNRDGIRPSSITVTLYANGTSTGKQATLAETNNWYYTFTDLPKYKNGKFVTYTIKETGVTGYTATEGNSDNNYTITNTHITEKINIPVTKIWNDKDDIDECRPNSITVALYKNGTMTGQTKELSASNNWVATFENLNKYENGSLITYTVREIEVPTGYTATEGNSSNNYTITNTHEINYFGYIEITGKVWLDGVAGKANEINGTFGDTADKGLPGIKVTLKDVNGNQFDATSTTTTDSDGNYTIKVNYDNSQNVYKLYKDSATVEAELETAYVEFEYDGMKYTTVEYVKDGEITAENKSKAKENEAERHTIDNKYSKVTPSTDSSAWENEKISATTQGIISFKDYNRESYTRTETLKYCDGNGNCVRTNPTPWQSILTATCTSCSGEPHTLRTYDVEIGVIKNVNLGLFEIEQPDVAIFSDISKVKVIMQGQEYTYLYNVRSNEKNNVGLKVKFENKDTYTYQRPVNPADIAYINKTNNDLMSVEVTYEVTLANLSTTLPVTIHNITTYFDNRYTLTTTGWIQNAEKEFSTAKNTAGLNVTINPGSESETIELTYSVSLEAIRELLNEDATLNHAVEIESYSTKYGANTLYAEQRTGGRNNQPYGGYDNDSHPGNAGIHIDDQGRLEATNLEDDTDIAPSFVLCKDEKYYKILSGNVWEDSDSNAEDGYRLGDGKKADTDKNVENVKVELYRVKDDGTLEIAQLYYLNTDTAEVKTKDAITYTDSNGNYAFGDENYSVVTDKYVIKFTYGTGIDGSVTSTINGSPVSARDYKSTIISQENINVYDLFKGTSTSDEWHLNASDGYSIAVDTIEERAVISDLQYSNFGEQLYITAWSKPFTMQVEFDPSVGKSSTVEADGITIYHNELDVFDFGIIERAREDIFVETSVEYLKITLANGQVLTEGDPRVDELNYAKPIGFSQTINNGTDARKALEKQVLVEIDTELMQGAQLDVKYGIKVTNNSEKDIDYYVNGQYKTEYYYFGTNNEGSPEINTSINYVVDYLDSELTYTWENADVWTQKSADELLNEGLISQATYNAIKENDYATYITTKFSNLKPGESMTDHVSAKKLLANQDENIYDNHAEILQIDAKTARTIKQTGTTKEYKMGNYVPSFATRVVNTDVNAEKAGLHEQDDDRLKIVITPPTGATNYVITYVITGLFGLIVIGAVIIFIKKKVLTK